MLTNLPVPVSRLLTMGSAPVKHSVLNVKAVVAAFHQEKALVGAFSVIIHHRRLIVYSTNYLAPPGMTCCVNASDDEWPAITPSEAPAVARSHWRPRPGPPPSASCPGLTACCRPAPATPPLVWRLCEQQ